MKNFTIETIEFAEKNLIDLSIVCTTKESQRYIESLLSNKIWSTKIKVLPFKKDLAKKLQIMMWLQVLPAQPLLKQF